MALEGDVLVMEFQATGAKFKLEPWDGDVFIARLMPTGQSRQAQSFWASPCSR